MAKGRNWNSRQKNSNNRRKGPEKKIFNKPHPSRQETHLSPKSFKDLPPFDNYTRPQTKIENSINKHVVTISLVIFTGCRKIETFFVNFYSCIKLCKEISCCCPAGACILYTVINNVVMRDSRYLIVCVFDPSGSFESCSLVQTISPLAQTSYTHTHPFIFREDPVYI